jgi:hypothetical protein
VPDQLSTPEGGDSGICLACGFCCDGTLFDRVVAGAGETAASFITIGLTPVDASPGKKGGFRQPCTQFSGFCSIYTSRPSACRSYRCRLLQSVKRGKYTVTEALEIVRETKALRDAVLPVIDSLHADALAAGAADEGSRRLVARVRVVVPLLFRPEAAQFREKYGKLLLTVFHLASRLKNDFLLKPHAGKNEVPAVVPTGI